MKYQMVALCLILAVSGCQVPLAHNMPPAEQIMHPGPGVDGPGPGVMIPGGGATFPFPGATSQIAFVGPDGMQVTWDVSGPGAFDSEPLVVPGRYNFPQGAIYRLKLTQYPGPAGRRALSDVGSGADLAAHRRLSWRTTRFRSS